MTFICREKLKQKFITVKKLAKIKQPIEKMDQVAVYGDRTQIWISNETNQNECSNEEKKSGKDLHTPE